MKEKHSHLPEQKRFLFLKQKVMVSSDESPWTDEERGLRKSEIESSWLRFFCLTFSTVQMFNDVFCNLTITLYLLTGLKYEAIPNALLWCSAELKFLNHLWFHFSVFVICVLDLGVNAAEKTPSDHHGSCLRAATIIIINLIIIISTLLFQAFSFHFCKSTNFEKTTCLIKQVNNSQLSTKLRWTVAPFGSTWLSLLWLLLFQPTKNKEKDLLQCFPSNFLNDDAIKFCWQKCNKIFPTLGRLQMCVLLSSAAHCNCSC